MRRAWLLLALLLPLLALGEEDAHTTGCLPANDAACVACHAGDAPARWAAGALCAPYCLTCHKKAEMARHHPVGNTLRRAPGEALPLTGDRRLTCRTCHLLTRPRYDRVRWKASSLYDRMFRGEARYPTYFLAVRNDQGQLCLSCH